MWAYIKVSYLQEMILHHCRTPELWSGAAGCQSSASAESSSVHCPTCKTCHISDSNDIHYNKQTHKTLVHFQRHCSSLWIQTFFKNILMASYWQLKMCTGKPQVVSSNPRSCLTVIRRDWMLPHFFLMSTQWINVNRGRNWFSPHNTWHWCVVWRSIISNFRGMPVPASYPQPEHILEASWL